MSDTIRWRVCFTHNTRTEQAYSGGDNCDGVLAEAIEGLEQHLCDVADALVIRADQPVYLIDEDYVLMRHETSDPNRLSFNGVLMRIGEDT